MQGPRGSRRPCSPPAPGSCRLGSISWRPVGGTPRFRGRVACRPPFGRVKLRADSRFSSLDALYLPPLMRRRFPIGSQRPAQIVGLALAALLLGLFLALPLSHQLFHQGSGEPETCPVRMLESSLVLLFLLVLSLEFLRLGSRGRTPVPLPVPLLLFFCGFFCSNRAPPHS